ncbi:hypothetical protein EYF80_053539 [Liparis tanakae]|uniref:Uncharacterized protein n=1 Tax=Liparis tanakae TaxID=230148 RepID=A0A4Z2F6A8_9TELE|nr:hypothetical protein EYF80_053539 [Liparis tanakae]
MTEPSGSVLLRLVYTSRLPDLDLPGPVAGGGGGRQEVVLSDAQAGPAVGEQRVKKTSGVEVVEVSRAGGAPRGQDAPVRRELALHGVSLHLEAERRVSQRRSIGLHVHHHRSDAINKRRGEPRC